MWELFFCVALSSQINIELFFQKKVPVLGKKVRQKTGSKYNELDM